MRDNETTHRQHICINDTCMYNTVRQMNWCSSAGEFANCPPWRKKLSVKWVLLVSLASMSLVVGVAEEEGVGGVEEAGGAGKTLCIYMYMYIYICTYMHVCIYIYMSECERVRASMSESRQFFVSANTIESRRAWASLSESERVWANKHQKSRVVVDKKIRRFSDSAGTQESTTWWYKWFDSVIFGGARGRGKKFLGTDELFVLFLFIGSFVD